MTPTEAIETYIRAKDGNRPFLMKHALADDVELAMVVRTDAISFPSSANGRDAITDILVRRFAADNENIFTFCLSRPAPADESHFRCHWLVGMSAKSNGGPRVGCGRYDWQFERGRVTKLAIDIETMSIFSDSDLEPIMAWLSAIPYPWCTPADALRGIPPLSGLAAVRSSLSALATA